jgi:hypothetical protein
MLMAPDARSSTEFVNALQMVEQTQFDLVCHAHRYYLYLTALRLPWPGKISPFSAARRSRCTAGPFGSSPGLLPGRRPTTASVTASWNTSRPRV